ncbi:sigma-70 family RNA polymerase sigma factor [Sinirhodobacter ferrireducens]|uniref:RNA polymerase sigma factor n=1 Tax=Paenirhodobacter ferrireducens TaxID=1215032 RepID=A0A443L9Y5_9RHOB|nr:sigma-70 family RNA polymerase sigma factor [Sinirhodobacter ferrireducens]RWR45949.1 sigma-70 family RNA polymerase sigma factor [Sinirhodobacter ferrireducens]
MERGEEAQALMAALARGERAALARLIALYGPGVQRFIAAQLGSRSEAEDIAQEVFLRVWAQAGRYDPAKGAVSSWIWRIALNLCIDRRRRLGWRRFLGLEAAPETADEAPDAEAVLDGRQRLAQTRAALARLPERQRAALLLRAAGGLATAEIAAALGVSPGAAEQLLVRGRAGLRAQLGPGSREEEKG